MTESAADHFLAAPSPLLQCQPGDDFEAQGGMTLTLAQIIGPLVTGVFTFLVGLFGLLVSVLRLRESFESVTGWYVERLNRLDLA